MSQFPANLTLPKDRRRLLPIAGLAACGIAAAVYTVGHTFWPFSPGDALRLSGRIEGYETDIGTKVVGRVATVSVREGDRVSKNQLLVRLDDDELAAQLAGTRAQLAAAEQRRRKADLELGVLAGQVREASLALAQSRDDARGKVDQAEAAVAQAEAQRAQARAQQVEAEAKLRLARTDRARYQALAKEGAVTTQELDQATSTFEAAAATAEARKAEVEAARRQVLAQRAALVQARTASLNPDIRAAQLAVVGRQEQQARAQLAAAIAEVASSRAQEQELIAQRAYLQVKSPIAGVVTARAVEPGTVVTTGKTLLTLVDLDTVYLRGYVPAGQIGRVRVGQRARVFLDSAPDRGLNARVAAVDPQASFTPENVYFRDERVAQVFGVKLAIEDPAGFAKPGMPADGEILLDRQQTAGR